MRTTRGIRVLTALAALSAAWILGACGSDTDTPPEPTSYKVMSFNVLCAWCDDTYDPWEERLKAFQDIFSRYAPDLMGLQELMFPEDVAQVLAVAPGFAALYYEGNDAEQWLPNPDATLMYRIDRFDVLEHGIYWLSPTPDIPWSVGLIDGQVIPRHVHWARLNDRLAGREIFFAVTHFDANNPAQEKMAPMVLERTAPWADRMPVILVGDFNAEPAHPAYAILTGGVAGQGFRFQDAYALAPEPHVDSNDVPPLTYDPAIRIDHVFVAGTGWTAADWRVDLTRYGTGPKFPSDHWPIVADLRLAP